MLKNYKKLYLVFICIFLVIFNLILFRIDYLNSHRQVTFSMLDVGQGDAFLIQSSSGIQVLVDSGPNRKIINQLSRIMPTFDRSLDAIIITNPDQDHIGGLSEILKNYSVGIILEPGTTNSSQTYQNLKKEIEKENIPNILAKKGMILDLGNEVFIEILFPNQDVLSWDRNDGSLVARLFYKNNSILLTGDATSKTEKILLANYSSEKLKNDILKIGHHGSRSSTSRDFLQAVDPQYALISSGFNNNYGHPHQEVLDLLFDFNVQLFRTDQLGMLKITMDGLGYKFAFSNNLFNK